MRILLVEPYYGGSHRAWADGYARASAHDVSLITHPGEFWRWRLRGGAVTLAEQLERDVADRGRPDMLLVSSMVDLPALLGLSRKSLGPDVPVVLYLHENQVAYAHPDAEATTAAWQTWTSMVAADAVIVNSHHHRTELSRTIPALLATGPDQPHDHLLAGILDAMQVIPVGVDLPDLGLPSEGRPTVLWNHRWDPDKNPDVFVRALQRLAADGRVFDAVLAGADGWDGGTRRSAAAEALGDLVRSVGPFGEADYRAVLGASDVVVSVADHEYFGVAMVEAIAAGCVPVLPRRLSYPELIPERFHAAVFYEPGGFRRALDSVVANIEGARTAVSGLAESMERFSWRTIAPRLDQALALVAA